MEEVKRKRGRPKEVEFINDKGDYINHKRGFIKSDGVKYALKPRPILKESLENYIGAPGTVDLDGLYIPKHKKKVRAKAIPEEEGKIRVAMRRSFYSGRRHVRKDLLQSVDRALRTMCSNPNMIRGIYKNFMVKDIEVDPKIKAAQTKYRMYMVNIGRHRKSETFVKEHSEGILTVDGVHRVRKVLGERQKLHPERENIVTGVVVSEEIGAE